MKYGVKKTQLTINEVLEVVRDAVDVCFLVDDEGRDIDFTPEYKDLSLQAAFCEKYLDVELSEKFEEAYDVYMSVDTFDYYDAINSKQWISILKSVDKKVAFRKQQLLNKNNTVNKQVEELLQKQIEVQDLQKEILLQQKKMNEVMTPEEQKAFADKITGLNDDKVIAEIVKLVNKQKKAEPQDHKKPQTKKNDGNITTLPLPQGK